MGNELWLSDGTSDGTILLKDISSGEDGSDLGNFVSVSPSLILFTVGNPDTKLELWRTNGTSNGTCKIEDFDVEDDVSTQSNSPTQFRQPVLIGTNLYFMLGDDELWRSNCINDTGTELIYRFRSGTAGSDSGLFTLVQNGNAVFAHRALTKALNLGLLTELPTEPNYSVTLPLEFQTLYQTSLQLREAISSFSLLAATAEIVNFTLPKV